jgi:ribose transport system ATP-binding protein
MKAELIPLSPPKELLRMRGIRKSFSGVEVLRDVDFDLLPGEVHVLAGENGAGKSTLMKVLAGVYADYEGEVRLKGEPVRFSSPHEARDRGISAIYQELSLVDSMTVAENLFLAMNVQSDLMADRRGQTRETRRVLAEMGLAIDPDRRVEEYPLAIRQLIEIVRAISLRADILIMDEPTSTLSGMEVERLFEMVRTLTGRGCGVIYISHKLEEIYRIANRITVLRDGATISTSAAADLPREELIRRMVGREVNVQFPSGTSSPGKPLLSVRHLTVPPGEADTSPQVNDVSFVLHESEVVGLAGLQGCGNSEVLQALFGALGKHCGGENEIHGRRLGFPAPATSIAQGLILQTNDRKSTGLVMEMSIVENIMLASLRRYSPFGWRRKGAETASAARQAERLQLRYSSLGQEVETLSGGGQQKVVFAKWLETNPSVLLLDDPTRGIDVGAKFEIYALILRLKQEGCGILLVSSELPELLGLSDRILVMRHGRIVRELSRGEATQEEVLRAALVSQEGANA